MRAHATARSWRTLCFLFLGREASEAPMHMPSKWSLEKVQEKLIIEAMKE